LPIIRDLVRLVRDAENNLKIPGKEVIIEEESLGSSPIYFFKNDFSEKEMNEKISYNARIFGANAYEVCMPQVKAHFYVCSVSYYKIRNSTNRDVQLELFGSIIPYKKSDVLKMPERKSRFA